MDAAIKTKSEPLSPWTNLHQPLNLISQRQDESGCPLHSSLLSLFCLDKFIWEEACILLFAELWYYTACIFSYATSRILASRAISIFIHAFASNDATPFSNAYLIGENTGTWPNTGWILWFDGTDDVPSSGLLILQLTQEDYFFACLENPAPQQTDKMRSTDVCCV